MNYPLQAWKYEGKVPNSGSADEKRRNKRMKVSNSAQAIVSDEAQDVQIGDVSAGSASIGFDHNLAADDMVELLIDDVGELNAQVSRSLDDGVAARFVDIDDEEEDMLLADLERVDFDIRSEEF